MYKTKHLSKSRVPPLGARAQAVLDPFLDRSAGAYCLSPWEAAAEGRAGCPRVRPAAPKRPPGERYATYSYRHAV